MSGLRDSSAEGSGVADRDDVGLGFDDRHEQLDPLQVQLEPRGERVDQLEHARRAEAVRGLGRSLQIVLGVVTVGIASGLWL